MQIPSNGLQLEVDDRGPRDAEALVLVMGLGMQLTAWPEPLVQALVGQGLRVIRFDNRDAGLSQGLDHLGVPSLGWAALKHTLRLPIRAPYALADMAEDALGVLDALGVDRAHLCGASMGGMIVQHLAARHPSRVRSLSLLMTSSGSRSLPQPAAAVQRALLSRPRGSTPEAVVEHLERLMRLIGSERDVADPPAVLRERLQATVRRAWRPQGTARHLLAVAADGDRSRMLQHLRMPTLVLHGQADPLIPVAAAQDLAHRIQGASLQRIPHMGHDLPLALLPRLAAAIGSHCLAHGADSGAA
jgi:pimeloyl-ACP methyl ester carboxylesterase